MTREEAIQVLRHIIQVADTSDFGIKEIDGTDEEALDMAIKALEQEPCNTDTCKVVKAYMNEWDKPNNSDAIRRQAVLETLDDMDNVLDEDRTIENYKELLKECYEVLPPVNPQPKIGHWKVVSDGYGDNAYICECSECKDTVWVYKDADRKWNYCSNCGARMQEVEE